MSQTGSDRRFSWPFWPVVPLYPYGQRRTLRREVVEESIWTFDQLQGTLYVVVPVRMTVVRLAAGGLLVYAPVAPTPECLDLMTELVNRHGDVKYIVLPTVTGIEHKVFIGPFARHYPAAQVYVTPQQWSFPLNLPLSWLGFPPGRTFELPARSADAPFGDELDYQTLSPLALGLGPYSETALFHKASKTLLVLDAIVSIPESPPEIVQLDSYPLLFHAKDSALERLSDTPQNRLKGWQRIALFAFYFRPSVLEDPSWKAILRDAWRAKDRSKQAYFGVFPFKWQANWEQAFHQLQSDGQLLVAPVLQALIFNRGPGTVLDWAKAIAEWPFERIIPGHLDAPLSATPAEFYRAFEFLEGSTPARDPRLPAADFDLLRRISQFLKDSGITPPPQSG
ncbi:MAG: DUF4336 domain-containing protein [Cyanobacteria bacterium P01_A01_bin.105]